MWYLTVPPIIVVSSLLFVLWYLSRKGADPSVAEKVFLLEAEADQRIPFLRTKNYFLGVLEKTAYRFKVNSLRMHNALNVWTQAIKVRRRNFQEKVAIEDRGMPERRKTQSLGFFGVLKREKLKSAFEIEEEKLELLKVSSVREVVPILSAVPDAVPEEASRRILRSEVPYKKVIANRQASAPLSDGSAVFPPERRTRSMVSEIIAEPDRPPRKSLRRASPEEGFIAQIASNPKDYAAYEGLGDFYLENGNVKDAKECYRQVLKLSPLQRMVKIKIRRLERMWGSKEL